MLSVEGGGRKVEGVAHRMVSERSLSSTRSGGASYVSCLSTNLSALRCDAEECTVSSKRSAEECMAVPEACCNIASSVKVVGRLKLWRRVQYSVFRVHGSGCRVQDSGFRIQGS